MPQRARSWPRYRLTQLAARSADLQFRTVRSTSEQGLCLRAASRLPRELWRSGCLEEVAGPARWGGLSMARLPRLTRKAARRSSFCRCSKARETFRWSITSLICFLWREGSLQTNWLSARRKLALPTCLGNLLKICRTQATHD